MMFGQTNSQQGNNGITHIELKVIRKISHRPKAPARYNVECTYSSGYMEFTFPPGVSYMHVEICEGETPIFEGNVTPDSPAIETPVLYGEHTVTCITDEGVEYGGIIYFDDEM